MAPQDFGDDPRAPSGWLHAPAKDDPRAGGWLVEGENCTSLGLEIVERAYCDIGICEQPESSNRGVRIDAMAKRFGSPPGSYWCALWLMGVWADRGAYVPEGGARVENWRKFCPPAQRMTISQMLRASPAVQKQLIGAAILYEGIDDNRLEHIGIIARITAKRVFTIEGNRGFAGGVTNNGEWVNIEPCTRHDVYGVVVPKRSPLYTPKKQVVRRVAA